MLLFLFGCILSGDPVDHRPTSVEWYEIGRNKVEYAVDTSVKISIWDEKDELGHGSGNHFSFRGQRFVLTAAHVVDSDNHIYILDGDEKVGAKIVFIDFERDVAILVPNKRLETKALRWTRNKSKKLVGKKTIYAGWPSSYGKTLISGMVSSVLGDEAILIHSFALPGSSGSVVFDKSGRVLGVVTAVGLHQGSYSPFPSLQEDMVYVSTISHLTDDRLFEVLKCGKQ